jgi:hypothetical protein
MSRLPPAGCAIWGLRLFILPHMYIGASLLGQVVLTTLWFFAGHDVPGQITRAWMRQGRKAPIYYVEYQYPEGAETKRVETNIGKNAYSALPAGVRSPTPDVTVPVIVRVFRYGVLHHAAALPPVGDSRGSQLTQALIFAAFWNGILSVFVYLFWIKPARLAWDVRRKMEERALSLVRAETPAGRG